MNGAIIVFEQLRNFQCYEIARRHILFWTRQRLHKSDFTTIICMKLHNYLRHCASRRYFGRLMPPCRKWQMIKGKVDHCSCSRWNFAHEDEEEAQIFIIGSLVIRGVTNGIFQLERGRLFLLLTMKSTYFTLCQTFRGFSDPQFHHGYDNCRRRKMHSNFGRFQSMAGPNSKATKD